MAKIISGIACYFNPRSPRGERPQCVFNQRFFDDISIHAPREGSDTVSDVFGVIADRISIHAPREGSDGIAACIWAAA